MTALGAAIALLAAFAACPALAQSAVSWSATAPAASGTAGGTGTWNTTDENWWTGAAAAAWNNAANNTAVFAGTSGTVTLGTNITAGGLSFNTSNYLLSLGANTLTLGTASNTLSLNNVTSGTISGLVTGTGNVRLDGGSFAGWLTAGSLNFTGSAAGGWSGTTTITQGQTLAISATSQALLNTAAINLVNGKVSLSIDNNATAAGLDRISNTAPISVTSGGSLSWSNAGASSATVFAETTGSVALASGEFTVNQTTTKTSGTQTLTLGSLSRAGNTATVRFAASGATPDTTRNRIVVAGATATGTDQIIGSWATVGTDYAIYDASGNVLPANIAASNENTWTAAANSYTTASPQTLTATRTITALRLTATTGTTLTVATNANLETFGILSGSVPNTNPSSLAVNATGSGVITTPTGGGSLVVTTNFASNNTGNGTNRLRISAPITDNFGAVTIVKTGPGGLELTGSNSFTGGLVLNSGRLTFANNASLGAASGGITFAGDARIDSTPGIGADRTITVNAGVEAGFYSSVGGANVASVLAGNGVLRDYNSSNSSTAFTNTANSFSGPVVIRSGRGLGFASLGDAESVFIGSNSTFAVRFTWTGTTRAFNNRQFVFSSDTAGAMSGIENNGSGPLTIARDLGFVGTSTRRVLLLGGASAGFSSEFSGRINDSPAGVVAVTKESNGTWLLSATNTYTGTTTLTGGDLAISSDANISGTASPLLFQGGTLKILGTSLTSLNSNRPTTFSGTGASHAITIGFNIDDPANTFTVSQNIAMATGTGNLTKTGLGTLRLTGTSSYTGTTTVSGGVLLLSSTAAVSAASGRGYTVNAAGVLAAGYALDQALLDKTGTASTGVIALTGGVSNPLNFSSGSLASVSLGAVGSGTYSGTLTPNGTTYRLGGGGGTLDFQSALTGAGNSLTVGGNTAGLGGTVILSNAANSFSGPTTVQVGVLEIGSLTNSGSNSAVGTNASITLGSGTSIATLRYVGSGDTSNRTISIQGTVGGTVDASGSGALDMTSGTISAASNTTVTLTGMSTAANTIGMITGAGVSVNKTGPGTWRLSGASTYSGTLTVSEGTLVVGSNVGAAGSPQGNSPFGFDKLPVIGNAAATSGTVALLLADGVSVYRGFSVVSSTSQDVVLGGTGSGLSRFGVGVTALLSRGVTLQASTSGTVEFDVNWRDSANNLNPNVGFTVGSPGNDGTVVLASLPTSITGVNVVAGTARLNGGTNSIWYTTPVSVGSANSAGTLDLNGLPQSLASLSFTGNGSRVSSSVDGGTLRLFNSGTTATVSVTGTGHQISSAMALDNAASFNVASGGRLRVTGVIATGSAGAQSLTKTGAGILELSAANTYSGNTTVSDGTLVVNGGLGSGALSVAAAATLMGSGTIGGAATIAGIHSPGNSPGIESFSSDLSYTGSSSQVIWELWGNTDTAGDRGSVYDGINVGGNLDFAGATSLSLVFTGTGSSVDWDDSFWGESRTWLLFNVTTGTTTNIGNLSLASGPSSWLDASGQAFADSVRKDNSFTVTQQGSDVYVSYTVVVPEPGAIALAAIGIAAAAWARRRRQ